MISYETSFQSCCCCCKRCICRLGYIYGSCMVVIHPPLSSCISGILVQCVFRTVGRLRTTKTMGCSFSWFKSLRFLSLGHLKPNLYAAEVSAIHHLQQWIQNSMDMIQMTPGIFQRVRWSLFRLAMPCIQAKSWHVGHLFSNLERRPWFINHASEGLCL